MRSAASRPDETWVVVPAGGRGVRMGRKKQDLPVERRPILRWTLEVFERTPAVAGVVVVVPAEDVTAWRRRLGACRKVRAVVPGGAERQESVRRGLDAIPLPVSWIVVHDGVRPCITPDLVWRVLEAAQEHRAAVAAIPLAETLKRGQDGWVAATMDRRELWVVQTPQAFEAALLRRAHQSAAQEAVLATDDAGLVERLGCRVRLVAGLPGNIKVTRPEDLPVARALIRARRDGR